MGARPPAAALIKQDDAIDIGVKVAAHGRAASTARATMQHDNRYPVSLATLFNINAVPVTNLQHPLIEGIDRRIKMRHRALLT
jgi:hypothetical protein